MLYVDLHEPEKALVDLDRLVIRSPDDGLCLLCEGNRPGRPRQARRCAAGLQRGHQYYRSVGGYDDNRTPDTPPDMACTIQLGTLLQDASLDGIWTGSGRRIWAPSGECKGFGWAYARFYEFTLPYAATLTIRTTSTEPTYVNLRYGRDNVAIASSDHSRSTNTEIVFNAIPFTYEIEVVPARPYTTGSFRLTIDLEPPPEEP